MKPSEIFNTPEASGFDRVTPDTEVDVMEEPLHISAEALFKCQCKTKELLTSRDTYWKERVRKEVEGLKLKDPSPEGEYNAIIYSHNQALDTLLDNLK